MHSQIGDSQQNKLTNIVCSQVDQGDANGNENQLTSRRGRVVAQWQRAIPSGQSDLGSNTGACLGNRY